MKVGPLPGAGRISARRAFPTGLAGLGSRGPIARPLTGPVEPVRSRGAERSARRRREVVTILFTATMLSAAVASALGGVFWSLQILTDVLLLTYFAGMLWFRSNSAERNRSVHYLPQVRPRPVPAYALRRTASS